MGHTALAEKLRLIENAGIPVLVLPGNHDLENPMAASFQGTGYTLAEGIDSRQFREIYRDFSLRKAAASDSASLSYMAEIAPGLRVLTLDVNTAYVSGQMDEVLWDDDIFQSWRDRQAFLYVYLQSIINDGFQSHTAYTFSFD